MYLIVDMGYTAEKIIKGSVWWKGEPISNFIHLSYTLNIYTIYVLSNFLPQSTLSQTFLSIGMNLNKFTTTFPFMGQGSLKTWVHSPLHEVPHCLSAYKYMEIT